MKNTYWMVIITITFIVGFYLGQQKSSINSLVANTEKNTVKNQPVTQNNNATDVNLKSSITSQAHNKENSASATDIFEQIGHVLQRLDAKPEDKKLMLALYSLVSELSLIELDTLILTLSDKNTTQRDLLAQLIVEQLIELAPRKALSFAKQFNPMPESDYYLVMIKSAIAEKDPDYGFELLLEEVHTANSETELSTKFRLIGELAKHDLNRLMDTLVQYKNQGVDIKSSLWGLSHGLKTRDELNELFDQLTKLDDLDLLDSAIMTWVDISADDLFNKLNGIDDANERRVLIEKAQRYWLIKDPENAATSLLSQAENKKEALNDILRYWPSDKAEQGLLWLSRQEGIDINNYKIEFLDDLIYLEPKFVQAHLHDIELDEDNEAAFHLKLYHQLKDRSTSKAEQFLDSLSNKADVIALIETKSDEANEPTPTVNYLDEINKAFDNYYHYKEAKAFAVAIDSEGNFAWSYRVNQANQSIANQSALDGCEKYRLRENIAPSCIIYAEGDVRLFEL